MNLPKILFLALASSAAIASAQIVMPGTGAGSTPGAIDPNWDVYRFTDRTGLTTVTGANGLSLYLNYVNNGSPTELATARNSSRYLNAWIPAPAGNTWLSIAVDGAGNPIGDPNFSFNSTTRYGGGYAFLFDLGDVLAANRIALWSPVTLDFTLNGDNGFSAHLIAPDVNGDYFGTADLLGSTAANFNVAAGAPVSFTGTLTRSTQLVVLLSNDAIANTNPAGLLVTGFTAYNPVPEPSTYGALAGVALVGFAVWSRRKRR